MEATQEKPRSSLNFKRLVFPRIKKKKIEDEVPNHKYFSAHQCTLPSGKINSSEIHCSRLRKCFLNLTSVHMGDIRAENLYRIRVCTKLPIDLDFIPIDSLELMYGHKRYHWFLVKENIERKPAYVLRTSSMAYLCKYTNPHLASMVDFGLTTFRGSYAALCAEKYRHYKNYPFSIHPFSKLRMWLEASVLVGMVASNIILAVHFSRPRPNEASNFNIFHYIFNSVYLINIGLNFFTGYLEGNTCQYVVLDIKKIACKYVRSWLLIDVISTFCFFSGFIQMYNVYPNVLLVSMKLLRMPVLLTYMNNVLLVMRMRIFERTLVEILILILTYLSWNIFFQFGVEYMKEGTFTPEKPDNCSWISIAKLWNGTPAERFMYSLDRAVGMLRKNSNINLIERKGCIENFLIVAWLVAKLLIYHTALKYIVSLFGNESAKAKYFIMTKQVETLMNQRKFPPRIKEKILKFYAIRFQSNFFAESKMLSCVTGQLREDIIMHTGRQLVGELEFLKHLPRALLLQIGLKLKIVIFIAGDIIFKINTVGDCLYFIDKGSVAIYSESGNEICHLEDGDYFGEIALVLKHSIRTASAVAVTNCELFRLDKEDFDSSIACYSTVYEDIKKVAMQRYERTCVLDEHHKAELKIEQEHNIRKSFDDSMIPREQ